MPAVEPYWIVEYRWKELHRVPNVWSFRLQLQRKLPK